ncbi:hypothetical protein [Clostridium beijerinckii]|uniref:Anti-bacteriophage protein A/HamA C-terminal domain-containing protein n=1 Tax=Clostridium beijerinckii TaxID=1520 RepID=A0AAW3WG64_CLOBE|nr:hypothetical protein [Clostridium beijerinckii]MBC2460319.1 hypothetical protein [Clostridium beijerinckii]MBC2477817.1 hypothetical protein [Clostridium beijerinckii]NOV59028.1 hypothetical protein [Clostridium beijerinckii]NOV71584.1 hypothetical protein [Clostridium beijerinckii]NOW32383.1 hypothetical protein [Clostridium beijerinckii]
MKRWLKNFPNHDYIESYLRIDYLGYDESKTVEQNQNEFKQAIINYFLNKMISQNYLKIKEDEICATNISDDYKEIVNEKIKKVFDRKDEKNKLDNIKGLIGETLCAWINETYELKPLYLTPSRTDNASIQGTDRWELYEEDNKLALKIWSAKCTEKKPSSRSVQIRENDFKRTEIFGIIAQIRELNDGIKNPFTTENSINELETSILKEANTLTLGVVIVFGLETYNKMYDKKKGQKLNVFRENEFKKAKRIIKFMPIKNIETYINGFEKKINEKMGI